MTAYKINYDNLDALRGLADKFNCYVTMVKKIIKTPRTVDNWLSLC